MTTSLALLLAPVLAQDPSPSPPSETVERATNLFEALLAQDWPAVLLRLGVITIIIVLAALLVIVARRSARRWVSRATAKGLAKLSDPTRQTRVELRAKTLGSVLADVTTVIIWVIAMVIVLGELNINLGPLIAGAGIAGVALGFGAQSLVKDFLSGFFILLEDQFGVGDVIQIEGDVGGVVEDISLRVTRMRSLDGTVWFVPNGEIRYLGNKSKEWARALVDIEVAYGEHIEDVMSAITDVSAALREDEVIGPKMLEDVEILGVEILGASGVTIRTFIKTLPLEQWAVSRRFRQEVKREFDRRGIEIPFPHRKLIIEDGAGAPAGAPRGNVRKAPTKRARKAP